MMTMRMMSLGFTAQQWHQTHLDLLLRQTQCFLLLCFVVFHFPMKQTTLFITTSSSEPKHSLIYYLCRSETYHLYFEYRSSEETLDLPPAECLASPSLVPGPSTAG